MKKTIELKLTGYRISGAAALNTWGGGSGFIMMKPSFVTTLTAANIRGAINDNGFGCERITHAVVKVSPMYGTDDRWFGCEDFEQTRAYYFVDPQHRNLPNRDWSESDETTLDSLDEYYYEV